MANDFLLQSKIIWHGKISNDLRACFYPSFYKDLLRRESTFTENFTASLENATAETLKNKFIPIYQAEIMSRINFTLEKDRIISSMEERIEKNPSNYKFLFIYGQDGEVFGATLLLVTEDKLQMSFRAYKREPKINALKHKASLDYWGEKLAREYGFKMGLKIFSHGRDTHPYVGRNRIGLALYKLKAGTKPRLPDLNNPEKPVTTNTISESYLFSQKEPVVFFTNPDNNAFYKNCFLYYPEDSMHESFVNEFRVVSEWAGITFKSIVY